MLTENSARLCMSCSKKLRGRTDKKFCDHYCRNNFNNHLKFVDNNVVRNINNALKKNRRILEEILSDENEAIKTTLEKLLFKGFQLKYVTHTYTNQKGSTYFFCYDYGYLPLNQKSYLVVKNKEPGFKL